MARRKIDDILIEVSYCGDVIDQQKPGRIEGEIGGTGPSIVYAHAVARVGSGIGALRTSDDEGPIDELLAGGDRVGDLGLDRAIYGDTGHGALHAYESTIELTIRQNLKP
jgi:hypothetical protein